MNDVTSLVESVSVGLEEMKSAFPGRDVHIKPPAPVAEGGHAPWGKKVEVTIFLPGDSFRTPWAYFVSNSHLLDEATDLRQDSHTPVRVVLVVFRSNCQTKDALREVLGRSAIIRTPIPLLGCRLVYLQFHKHSDLPPLIQIKAR